MGIMYLKYVLFAIFLLAPSQADQDEILQRVKRNGNSYKTSTNKGVTGYDSSRSFKEMMDKMDRMDEKLTKLEAHMVKTSEMLSHWTETAGLEDHSYWKEITGCGGVIEATSGRIIGNNDGIDEDGHAYGSMECMWTILAGQRSKVKVTLKRVVSAVSSLGYMAECKILQLKVNYGNSSDVPVFDMTSITEDMTYMFRGPLLYLSCYCRKNPKSIFLEFEGMGPKVYSQVHFQNIHSDDTTGSFDLVTEFNKTSSQLSDKEVSFSTISLPGQYHDTTASLKNILLQSLSPEFCKSSSLKMHFDVAHPNSTVMIDCCKVDCLSQKFPIINGYCIITLSVNISTVPERSISSTFPDYLKLSWESIEHSKYDSDADTECGGVVSGRSTGRISQTYSRYRANSRCVWIIHPFPATEITVSVSQLTIEEEHDKLYAIGLDDDGQITSTTRFTANEDTYNLTGRVIIIVFYSDTSLQLTGFSLRWDVVENPNRTDLMNIYRNDDKIYRYTEKNGTTKWNVSMPPSWPGLHVGVINHWASFQPYSCDLSLGYALHGSASFMLLESTNGTFNLLINATGSQPAPFDSPNITSTDGIFLLIGKVYKPQSYLTLDLEWSRGKTVAPTTYSECGGRIESSQHARIDYKTGAIIAANTRCLWLIECHYPNVTFHLIKTGLGNYGIISIDTINSETGKIANATKRIDSTSGDVVVSGPLILVTFTSHIITGGAKGFELEYVGSGLSIGDDKNYQLQHLTTRASTLEYPMENVKPTSNDIYIFAQNSAGTTASSSKLSVQFSSHAPENSSLAQGYKFSMYASNVWNSSLNPFTPVVECTIETGDLEEECNFLQNSSYSDFHSRTETFDVKLSSGFFVIVKPLEATEGMVSREFELTWNAGGCGGIVGSLPNGKIEYKLYEWYAVGEDCFWIIDGSKYGASSIAFSLEASGINDRDNLLVYPILNTGVLGVSKRLRYDVSYSSYITATRNITVPSGMAMVVFRSTTLYYSTTGKGFRLSYTLRRVRSKPNASPPGKTLVLMYPNPLAYSEIELPFKKKMTSLNHNDTVVILFNAPPSTTSTTTNTAHYTKVGGSYYTAANITIQELTLFANNQTCTSDSLFFYYYSYGSFSLKHSYRSYKDPEATCNETITTSLTQYADEEYDLGDIYEDITMAPRTRTTHVVKNTCNPACYESNVLKTLSSTTRQFQTSEPFLVIYKSNSNNGVGKKIRFSVNQPGNLTSPAV